MEEAERTAVRRVTGPLLLGLDDDAFPRALLIAPDPPKQIWVHGDLALLDQPSVGIIGTRKPSRYGLGVTHDAARELAQNGAVVVSGLAAGLDARAHQGALDAGGGTIAVLGTGIDVPYPACNAGLLDDVKRRGLVITEFEPGTGPRRGHFVQRNRLIAALSRVLLVVEGRIRSGTANTAGWMQRIGRQVFAVPGRLGDPMSEGPNNMLRDGASPYVHPNDVLRLLGLPQIPEDGKPLPRSDEPEPDLHGAEATVFDVLGRKAVHVDVIAERSRLEAGLLLAALSSLEMRGLVEQRPGKLFALSA